MIYDLKNNDAVYTQYCLISAQRELYFDADSLSHSAVRLLAVVCRQVAGQSTCESLISLVSQCDMLE